jgi:hypothetical protein
MSGVLATELVSRRRRILWACALEGLIVLGGFVWSLITEFSPLIHVVLSDEGYIPLAAFSSAPVVQWGGVLVAEAFIFLLSGRTFLVWFYFNYLRRIIERGSDETSQGVRSETEPLRANRGPNRPKDRPRGTDERFAQFLARSEDMVKAAQARPTALLLAGVVMALIGLGVFVTTSTDLFISGRSPAQFDVSRSLMDLAPKLLMLIFVQVLAGFFLKQYRVSMAELRYYEAVLRYREAQYVAYLIRREKGDAAKLLDFATEIMAERDFLSMPQGQTNILLETQRLEQNEFKGIYERFFDYMQAQFGHSKDDARPGDVGDPKKDKEPAAQGS